MQNALKCKKICIWNDFMLFCLDLFSSLNLLICISKNNFNKKHFSSGVRKNGVCRMGGSLNIAEILLTLLTHIKIVFF